ncbi:DinB family protein [Spirosoma gilvum]
MKEHLIELLNYELWSNHRVIEALETVRNPPQRAIAVMGHILSAQQIWIGRITAHSVFISIWEDIPVGWMAETADRQHRQLSGHIGGLSEPQLTEIIAYKDSKGNSHQTPLTEILTHMSHHAAYHRGQVVQLIRPMLDEPPVTDYIVWVRENQK